MDIFDSRSAAVMLTGLEGPAFDDPDYIFELKLDGDRCLAYLDGQESVLINKRNRYIIQHVPELAQIHRQVKRRCILDGELIIGSGHKHEFERVRERLTTTNRLRLEREAKISPATFLAFDILYLGQAEVLELPLLRRKELLRENIKEGPRLALSRYIPERGRDFFDMVAARGLEGVMAKRADSLYRMGKRSRDWVKCKNWDRDQFVICGYLPSDKANVVSLILAQYRGESLAYVGHVVLGRRSVDFRAVQALTAGEPAVELPPAEAAQREKIAWVRPQLVCEVEFVCRTASGGLRQPIYQALRPDLEPADAAWPETLSCTDEL